MEKIQELKKAAYEIAMEKYYGGKYAWPADVRLDAMRTYAQLVMAEKTTAQN